MLEISSLANTLAILNRETSLKFNAHFDTKATLAGIRNKAAMAPCIIKKPDKFHTSIKAKTSKTI